MPTIYLSCADEDLERVEHIYQQLLKEGFTPWLKKYNLLPGQDWRTELEKVITQSQFFLVFMSSIALSENGFYHRELKIALEIQSELPEGRIFLIPVYLDQCEMPTSLEKYRAVKLYEEASYLSIVKALEEGFKQRGLGGLTLEIIAGPEAGRKHRLFSANNTIGRAPGSNVVINDSKVSGLHAVLEFNDKRLIYRHISKKNSSVLRSDNVQKLELSLSGITISPIEESTFITIGDTTFKVSFQNTLLIKEADPTATE